MLQHVDAKFAILHRLSDAPVGSANERKNIVSDGIIHISSQLMLVAQLLRKDFFDCHPNPVQRNILRVRGTLTSPAHPNSTGPTLRHKNHWGWDYKTRGVF